jgi:hypothetical protein
MNASAREATLFQVAAQLGAAERAAFLDRECACLAYGRSSRQSRR